MDIAELELILDGGVTSEYIDSLTAREGVQHALALLNIVANIYDNNIEKELSKLVCCWCFSDLPGIDSLYRCYANNLVRAGIKLDRWRMCEAIRTVSSYLEGDYLTDEIVDNIISHQLTSRSDYIEFFEGEKTFSCAEVLRYFNCGFDLTSSTEGWLIAGENKIPLSVGEGDYAVLGFDGERKTAEIYVDVEQLDCLSIKETLSICHEVGHALNHILSSESIGDFSLCLFDVEVPSLRSELLFAESISDVARTAFAIDCLKQSVFSIFSIMAPEVGAAKAFELAISQNTIYGRLNKDLDWIVRKEQLFQWTGVPYIQYFSGFVSALHNDCGAATSLKGLLDACVDDL